MRPRRAPEAQPGAASVPSAPRASRLRALAGWAVTVALGCYIVFATIDWSVPWPGGLRFGPLWAAGTAAAIAAWAVAGRRVTAVSTLAIAAVVAMLLTDASYLASDTQRDLHLYLRAGERFAAGDAVYLDRLVTERPDDPSTYPFLYPPVTLPMFAVLAALPSWVVDVAWAAGSIAAALAAMRLFGLPWSWAFLMLAWPPVFQGIEVGNVAVLLAVLFAAAPRWGAGLLVAPVFKVHSGLAVAWLVRERRWRQVALGVVLVGGACLASLPLTGADRWAEWWHGLALFGASAPLLPASLYGFGLLAFVPAWAAAALAGAALLAAILAAGHIGLARVGLASAIASPSLYSHGLIVALPAFLELAPRWLWVALAITAVSPGIGWWAAIALALAAWFIPGLRRVPEARTGDEGWHPLPPGAAAWEVPRERPAVPADRSPGRVPRRDRLDRPAAG